MASRKKTHKTRFSEADFVAGINKYGHFTYCVKISYKSKNQKFVNNAICQYQTD